MYGIVDVLDKLKEINIFYGIDNTDVETCIQNFSVEKVCGVRSECLWKWII